MGKRKVRARAEKKSIIIIIIFFFFCVQITFEYLFVFHEEKR